MLRLAAAGFALVVSGHPAGVDGALQFATFTACPLESGATIVNCRIGYRTFGRLNAHRTNAVLVPTAFTATSATVAASVGAGKLLDPSEHYIIAVDALGNGVSSSPSNSATGGTFPTFTMRDVVATQHRLVTEVLDIPKLHAVVGTSMGGMQAFQWVVSHPTFVDRTIAIHGSPQLSSHDLLLWETMLRGIEATQRCTACDPVGVYAPLAALVLDTPQRLVREVPREGFADFLRRTDAAVRDHYRPEDVKSQLRAMMGHDVAAPFAGGMHRAAERVGAGRLLVVVALQDHVVRPEPAIAFARLARGEIIELTGDCGHRAAQCEAERVTPRMRTFLTAPR